MARAPVFATEAEDVVQALHDVGGLSSGQLKAAAGVGAMAGAVLAVALVDWALIAPPSLGGTSSIVPALDVTQLADLPGFTS